MIPILKRRLFNVDEYHMMAEAGILTEKDKVELINGEIVLKHPDYRRNASYIMRLNALFANFLDRKVIVSIKQPIQVDNYSETEPDIALLKFQEDFYVENHPTSDDTLLIIEVSNSAIAINRNTRLSLYSKSGIQEFWIVNLQSDQIEVYKNPKGDSYEVKEIYKKQQSIKLEQLDALIDVSKIFF